VKKLKDLEDPYKDLKIPKVLTIGNKYFSIDLKQTVTLKLMDNKKKMAKVSKGALTINCPVSGLRDTDLNKQNNHSSHNISFKTDGNSNIEYDCRGMRLEEFQSLVETVSAELITGAIPFVNMIHGHGTGVLKTWLRNYIKMNKDLSVIKDTTGNDGETRFTLKS
jgi:DNA mismatch repair protein MutS2